jgi:RNA-binding protein NOB1
MAETPASTKPVHTIVLDAGPLLKNVPPLSTLLAQSEELVTTPSVINEIRDADARTRIETLYLPFLKQRSPSPKSVNVLSEFARKTGDRAVLSKVDVELLALAYEIECERNGGDWRLRSVPGQKGVNGRPPVKERAADEGSTESKTSDGQATEQPDSLPIVELEVVTRDLEAANLDDPTAQGEAHSEEAASAEPPTTDEAVEGGVDESQGQEDEDEEENEEDSDGGDWITPSNIKKRQAKDETIAASATPEPKVMQVATMTTDFAVRIIITTGRGIILTNASSVKMCSSR